MRFFSREEIRDGVYNLYQEIENNAEHIQAAQRLIEGAETVYETRFKTVAGRDIIGRLIQWGFEMNGESFREYVSADDLKFCDFAYTLYIFQQISATIDQFRSSRSSSTEKKGLS